jgi:polyhydroxybutyrate depolymerase
VRIRLRLCLVVLAALGCTRSPQAIPPLSDASGSCILDPGSQIRTISVGAQMRRYRVQVGPEALAEGGAPLIFLWHGFGQSSAAAENLIRPARDWPAAIVVTPEGLPRLFGQFAGARRNGWQVRSGELEDRDLRFFDAMLEELAGAGCADPTRVYSAGFSNGAFFSNLLGCVRSNTLAAIAPVAGGGPFGETCEGPMPVLITHGRSDRVVPFGTAERALGHWARQSSCRSQDTEEDRCIALPGCDSAAVGICSHSGGHVWPAQATPAAVQFFQNQRKMD